MKGVAVVYAFIIIAAFLLACMGLLRFWMWRSARKLRNQMASKPPVIRLDVKRRRH